MKAREREQAVKLRKEGYSLKEISVKLNVSKSSVSGWVRHIPLSCTVREKLYSRGQQAAQAAHKRKTREKMQGADREARRTLKGIDINRVHARLLCAMLYWCEGAKSDNDRSFIFSNSDPELVAAFLHLFRTGFDVDESRFRVCLHLHEYHDQQRELQFWHETTKIPLTRFIKPYRKKNTGKRTRENYAGCASIRYHGVEISRQVQATARAFLKIYRGP